MVEQLELRGSQPSQQCFKKELLWMTQVEAQALGLTGVVAGLAETSAVA